DSLAGLPQDAILDGEIVAWDFSEQNLSEKGRALPFSTLQQRLGRKKVSADLMRQVPVAYLVFDVIYAAGELLIDRPLRERAEILNDLVGGVQQGAKAHSTQAQGMLGFAEPEAVAFPRIIRAPVFPAGFPELLEQLFAAARERGNEGLMIKDLDSGY